MRYPSICLLALLLMTACTGSRSRGEQAHGSDVASTAKQGQNSADDVLRTLTDNGQYTLTIVVADSLQKTGAVSETVANYFRGVAYSRQGLLRAAEACWQKNMVNRQLTDTEDYYYYESAASLANLLVNMHNYEGALRIALPAVTQMENTGSDMDLVQAILHESIGRCQLSLGRVAEAEASYNKAYRKYMEIAAADSTSEGLRHVIVDAYNTALGYLHARHYADAQLWIQRTDSVIRPYKALADANQGFAEHVQTRLNLQHAVALQGLGHEEEAATAFREYAATGYGQSSHGRVDATTYLLAAGRYAEAADNYRNLDGVLQEWGMDYSLDNIRGFLLPKFRANMEAGRRDSALAVARQTFNLLDSAIERAKLSDAAELATVYETQQMETEIVRQQADLSRQRLVGVVAVSLLLTAFFIFYILFRRRAQRRLQSTFDELQTAYDQLRETTEAKERIENELHIARDIQMSMVPSVFPNREGLDLYASMQPAREVGGDLYDYVLLGDRLYFCVGDVSGKGVPASLVMAQTARLFRSLATQDTRPARIAQRINVEMTANREATHSMFVTMFIGLADLRTGRLVFCNAGHNPPVLGGDSEGGSFLKMEANAPIGLWPDLEFVEEEIENIKGRPLLVYTDGLTEAEDKDLRQFGEERLLDILRRTRYNSARQVIEKLAAEVDRHRQGAEPNDDLTILCLRINP